MARLAVRVQGGTGAGVKDPIRERAADWICPNGHENRGCWLRCLTSGCNAKRPKA